MDPNLFTPIDDLSKIHQDLRIKFNTRSTLPIPWRQHQLLQLARMFQDNDESFANALYQDMGRPALEAYTCEITGTISRCITVAQTLPEWATARDLTAGVAPPFQAWAPTVYKAPKGVALVIVPWNYPIILATLPLIGVIASGCCCVLKLSEISPHCSKLFADLMPRYLDADAYHVVLGAVPEAARLLEFKWDHIFYTGNATIARIVAAAAAKHLTPLTLELGGKCPVILDPTYDLDIAAKRIMQGKCSNAGQICVSPDYLVVPTNDASAVVAAFHRAYRSFFPEDGGALSSSSFSRIVATAQFRRLVFLLDKTKGSIVMGGRYDASTLQMEPTLITDVAEDDVLLSDEIFGPILPLVLVPSMDAAIDFVNTRDHPLVLYVFTDDAKIKERMKSETTSGSLVFNATVLQMGVNEVPYGGVGISGYGRNNVPFVQDELTYIRGSIDIPASLEPHIEPLYPPYTEKAQVLLNGGVLIPESSPGVGLKKA
ncbi:aldehyde dehydrogenase [Hymenopellis radicata]|nr:aldehyde dehydrogenase [Hymenopellis radicata]